MTSTEEAPAVTPTLAAALAELQTQLPHVAPASNAQMPGGRIHKYANLAALSRDLLPIMGKLGLSFSAKPTIVDGNFGLVYKLRLAGSDETDEGFYPLPQGAAPHTLGSAITYGRRYCLQAVTGLAADEDDDGAAAQAAARPAGAREPRPQRQPARAANGGPEVDEHGAATFAEQTRMVTGAVPGTERLDGTPPGDPWHTVDENGERREPGELPGPPPGPQAPRPRRNYAPPPGEIDEAAQQFADKAADCRTTDELDAVKHEANDARLMAKPIRSPEDGKTAALGVWINTCRKAIREAEAAVT